MNYQVRPLSAGLYFVATPIGTARDITLRALDILASADVIASEDTRTTRKLMDIHGIPLGDRALVAFHDHSGEKTVERLIDQMKDGKSVACVSEAGTPLIADPGYELGVAATKAGVTVSAAPGPSAVITALSVAGLATDRFAFLGFLPNSKSARQVALAEVKEIDFTLVLYESPKRLLALLEDVQTTLGAKRQVVVCRELTKKFEEVRRGTPDDLIQHFEKSAVKGEIVVLVDRGDADETPTADIEAALTKALLSMRVKDAATAIAGAYGLPRKDVYQMALDLKERT